MAQIKIWWLWIIIMKLWSPLLIFQAHCNCLFGNSHAQTMWICTNECFSHYIWLSLCVLWGIHTLSPIFTIIVDFKVNHFLHETCVTLCVGRRKKVSSASVTFLNWLVLMWLSWMSVCVQVAGSSNHSSLGNIIEMDHLKSANKRFFDKVIA